MKKMLILLLKKHQNDNEYIYDWYPLLTHMSIKDKKKIIDLSISPKQESALKQGKSPFQANKRKSAFYMQAKNNKGFILAEEES